MNHSLKRKILIIATSISVFFTGIIITLVQERSFIIEKKRSHENNVGSISRCC